VCISPPALPFAGRRARRRRGRANERRGSKRARAVGLQLADGHTLPVGTHDRGEPSAAMFAAPDPPALGYRVTEHQATEHATHVVLGRSESTRTTTNEAQVRDLLQQWAAAARKGQRDQVLANQLPDVSIYDMLAPMKYQGAAAYRRSWDEWPPDTGGEGQFELQDLSVTVGGDVALPTASSSAAASFPSARGSRPGSRDLPSAKNRRRGKFRTSTSRNPSSSPVPSGY
jgi:ketosteroid isomerase-like protein